MKDQKSLLSPDHVLSLVVMLLSAFLIIGATYLYRAQAEYHDSGATIQRAADYQIRDIQLKRNSKQIEQNQ